MITTDQISHIAILYSDGEILWVIIGIQLMSITTIYGDEQEMQKLTIGD